MKSLSPKVLIIGSGITGALCASSLHKVVPLASIKIWDKARGSGGRMTTSTTNHGNKADLGAQYITTSNGELDQYATEYKPLLVQGVIKPFTASIEGMRTFAGDTSHFVAPEGMGSVVKYFLGESKVTVDFSCHISDIIQEGNVYKVLSENGATEICDVVVSTIPIPQFLTLPGIENILQERKDLLYSLKNVHYSTRFVLVLFYDRKTELPKFGWASKYLNDEIFRYVSIDNLKRVQENEAPSILFHTSVNYGKEHKERRKEDVEGELMAHVRQLFPELPQPASVKCHKWLYSQVVTPYQENSGCVVVSTKPTLILAGDAFTSSNFNGCIASARSAVDAIINTL